MGYSAILPGTDLPTYARQLVRVHDAVLAGDCTTTSPRPVVAKSWQRVVRAGLDPSVPNARDPLPRSETERRRRESPLRLVLDDLVGMVSEVADASQFLLVVSDAEGVVLWREGSARVRMVADRLGFSEGARWTEDHVGTNAIGTALAEEAPVDFFSAEHFEQGQHPWYCTAHPVHDPRTGDLLGIVDISGPALTLHPAVAALVRTGVGLAETRLGWLHEQRLERLRASSEHVLAGLPGPALVVDEHGWVAGRRNTAPRVRIEAPRQDTPITVPGIGLCVPERLRDGWLVRPADATRVLTAVLDAVGATLRIGSGDESWETRLSARHVQVLTRLHAAGPAGCTSAQLSRALYGDADHQVTVRAEISRLRRIAGTLIATQPYRIAPGVALHLH